MRSRPIRLIAVAAFVAVPALLTVPGTAAAESSDLVLQKGVNQPKPNVGDVVTFTVAVVNNGPNNAVNVSIKDFLPPGLQFINATPSQGTYNSTEGLWVVGAVTTTTIPQTLQLQTRVVTPDTVVNTATIAHSDQPDPNAGNNTASAIVTPQRADLEIAKTVDIPTPRVGDVVTFTVLVRDRGPDPATNVVVHDLMPAGLEFMLATLTQGTYVTGSGQWSIGTVDTNASPTLSIKAKLTSSGRVVNTASISHSDQFDPDPENNSASLTVPRTPTLTTVSSSGSPSALGRPVSFLATVLPPPDGGAVTFTSDGVAIGPPVSVETLTGTALASGIVTLPAGPHAIVAIYSGDANYLPSASGPITQVVNAPPRAPAPAITGLTITPSSFRPLGNGPSALASKRRRGGAKVAYRLSEAARVTFTVDRLRRGRHIPMHRSFEQRGLPGPDGFRFTGRLAGHALRPGRYELVATPSAGGLSGTAAKRGFQIKKASSPSPR